jgi:N-acetylmuramic acid 6-phosphate (MurNAc-6-P) etherase
MAKPAATLKSIQNKLTDIAIRVFEELTKTKATDKIKKSLSKSSKKTSRAIYDLLKKVDKENAKKALKEKKALAKKKKRNVSKKPKKVVTV